jgi:FAD/FMN-containing dehydrogenase
MAPHPTTAGEEAVESIPEAALEAFAAGLRGEVTLPHDPGYDETRAVWNGMIDRHPAIVARCAGAADVVDAVSFARERDLPLAVRGGGHNVAGNAVCDGGLVIDLSGMDGVRVDPEAGTARVGGGALLGDVDRETQLFGLATPLGVVSETGAAGLTLNGGLGHLRREYGLACDALESVDVVTAEGEVVTASAERNEELFWALRGGGGNFGVATSFEYRLHEVGPEVYALFTWYPGDRAGEVLRAFREYAGDADRTASVLPFYAYVPELEAFPEASWGDPALVFLGCYDGEIDDAEAEFAPLREADDPIADLSGPAGYTELQRMLDEDYPDGRRYYWKSVYLDELSDDAIDLVDRFGAESPSKLSTIDLWHLGGAIDDPDPEDTAFWHRGHAYMLNFEANWDDPAADDENVEWARRGITAARELPAVSGGYGNFPGFQEDPARTVYGDNYDRLVAVKDRYDPENVFRLGGTVDPSGWSED